MSVIDDLIGVFSPQAALKNQQARMARKRLIELEAAQKRRYEAAADGRLNKGRMATLFDGAGANEVIGRDAARLRSLARHEVRNSPEGAAIVARHADYIVGSGIVTRFKHPDPEVAKRINDLHSKFVDECETEGRTNLYGIQHLVVREMAEAGETLVRRRYRRPTDNLSVPLQLQLLEADFIDSGKRVAGKSRNTIEQGIEYDGIGRRRGYWLFKTHPGSSLSLHYGRDSAFVKADEIAHVFEMQRVQSRGVTWLAPVLNDLIDLRDYMVAEGYRKKSEACVVAVVTPGAEGFDPDLNPNIGIEETEASQSDDIKGLTDYYGNPLERFTPGMIAYNHDGGSISFNNPHVATGADRYLRLCSMRIAAGARLPYELMTGDYSVANFASGRLGRLAYLKFTRSIQKNCLIPQLCGPVSDWFLSAALLAGKISERELSDLSRVFTLPQIEVLNPKEDIQAAVMEVRAGVKSWPEMVAERGRDPDQVLEELVKYQKIFDDNELTLDVDVRKVSLAGQAHYKAMESQNDEAE